MKPAAFGSDTEVALMASAEPIGTRSPQTRPLQPLFDVDDGEDAA
jgi:hypothetical protein